MRLLRKPQITVANVLSCLALFLALGGAAYGATSLGSNSVKTKNLANGAVTTPKLRNGAVTAAKLRNGAIATGKLRNGLITTPKIADAAVTSTQIAAGAVRSGQLGGQVVTETKIKNGAVTEDKLGAESVTTGKIKKEAVTASTLSAGLYAQLVKNVSYVNAESASDNEDAKTVTATCPAGKQAIGGGARVNGELEEVAVTGSNPFVAGDGQRTGWSAFGRELPQEAGSKVWSITAFAVCAEL